MPREKKLPWNERQKILDKCAERQKLAAARKEKKESKSMANEILQGDFRSVTRGKTITVGK